ncbi:EamA family transporter [Gloeocapsa sp. PCC 73106]|uniref:EamA family transporter n=1 Tax=Gloeocapsa sp. PCC 73106 TaxID=102232 RepID=UPI000552E0B9
MKLNNIIELLLLAAMWGSSFMFMFLLPALPFTIPKTLPNPSIVLSVLALSLFCTAIAYLLYFRLIQKIVLNIFCCLLPVACCLFQLIIYHTQTRRAKYV